MKKMLALFIQIFIYERRKYIMNKEELKWLLQTIKNAETAELFVLAQYEHGRISSHVMADVGRERGWIYRNANQFQTTTTGNSSEYATPELTIAIT
jgi:hypothetical protein